MRRRAVLASAGATCLGLRRATARPAFPSHALELIVPFTPGTSVGINARLLQPHLERALGQLLRLQFAQGAGGITGHLLGSEAAPDGYTLTLVSSSLTTQPWLNRISVAMPADFTFVGQVTSLPSVLLVRAGSPWRALADLVAALRASPETLTTGTLVGWWPPALALALFQSRAAIKPHVVSSYYSGAELVEALSQGQLDFGVAGLADVSPSLNSGALRALAVSGRTRALPDTQTFRELGWDVTTAWWRGLAVPVETPNEVVYRLRAGLQAALASAELLADFAHNGLSVDPLDGPEFSRFVLDEYETFGALFTSLGLNLRAAKPM